MPQVAHRAISEADVCRIVKAFFVLAVAAGHFEVLTALDVHLQIHILMMHFITGACFRAGIRFHHIHENPAAVDLGTAQGQLLHLVGFGPFDHLVQTFGKALVGAQIAEIIVDHGILSFSGRLFTRQPILTKNQVAAATWFWETNGF